ncbi:DUF4158 domain-containing protein [Nonomuraea helvata]|uniref:DUF4158 domain-containing protein n=1 Tax=Nonomuraea helvata TaxID=37484 RepID=A0ABV5S3I0_9ACTN
MRDAYGYHQFEEAEWGRDFRTFLHGRAWTHAEGQVALFNQAVGWLRRHQVLLSGVPVPTRQVAEVRAVAEKRLHATVANATRRADSALPGAWWQVPEGRRVSELERLRRPPTRTTGTSMAKALERVDEISAFRLGRVKVDLVPPNRLATLAGVGLGLRGGRRGRQGLTRTPVRRSAPRPGVVAVLTGLPSGRCLSCRTRSRRRPSPRPGSGPGRGLPRPGCSRRWYRSRPPVRCRRSFLRGGEGPPATAAVKIAVRLSERSDRDSG